MATEKNTLKQFFVTGAKPNQAQYYLWMDSYWHKNESISINKIEGLTDLFTTKADADQLKFYAKTDASNIDVPTWKNALGVGDLPTNVATVDEGDKTGNVYTKTQTDANFYKKLKDPSDGKTYLLKIDGTAVNASDFGKVDKVMNIAPDANKNVDISGVAMDWSNPQQRFSKLSSKHNDAGFNRLAGFDSNGNFSEVGLPAMTNAMIKSTDSQKDTWRLANRKSNEGYSTGMPQIDYILPDVYINTRDEITYIPCIGLNLLLNTNDCEVKVININTLDEFQVSNIQTIAGVFTMFSFGINFFSMPLGEYKVQVRNGVLVNIDTTTFTLVGHMNDEILAIDFNKFFKDTLSEAYKATFMTGINYISKARDTVILGNTPICDIVSKQPVIADVNRDFIFTCILTLNTSAGGYLGDFGLGLTQGFVDNIFNTIQYGVKFSGIDLRGTLKSTTLINGLLRSNKQIQVQVKRKGALLSVITVMDGNYASELTTVNISNPLYFIFKNNGMTNGAYVTDNPIVINLLSLQYF